MGCDSSAHEIQQTKDDLTVWRFLFRNVYKSLLSIGSSARMHSTVQPCITPRFRRCPRFEDEVETFS